MIIYLSGPDTYRSSHTLSDMKEKFARERDPQGMNLVEISVGDTAEGTIIEQLHAAPFLAEKRMVVLKHLLADGSKELHALMLDHVQEGTLPSDIIVVVWDGEVKPRAKASKELLALLTSQQYSQVFEALEGRALERWIAKEVADRGGMIDTKALRALTTHSKDMWQTSHTIDQLVAYAVDRTIIVDDTSEFLQEDVDDNIFGLVDAAVAGKTGNAFDMIRAQYRSGKDAMYVFSMLLRQYRIMLDIADVLHRGGRLDAKALGLHPFVLKKTRPIVERTPHAHVSEQYLRLLEIDRKIKTGSGDPAVLVDQFVGGLNV